MKFFATHNSPGRQGMFAFTQTKSANQNNFYRGERGERQKQNLVTADARR
jgi:hypothetical protein